MRVLIVDDDQVDREHVKRILRSAKADTHIIEAQTVDEGLTAFGTESFDMVLLDYKMPRRDGIEMLKELRALPVENRVAIVMMSTAENESLALECLRFGAQDFIPKSEISNSRLVRALAHAHTRFELEKELWQSYKQVKHLAEKDALTGLSNRYLFDETLKNSVLSNERLHAKVALILFDIDNFKFVNDTYGHDIGDSLLQRTVQRVSSCMRGNELFYRLGGDEFAIVIPSLDSIRFVSSIANRIKNIFSKPFEFDRVKFTSSVSMGIAINPDNGKTASELYKQADIAMYRAKKLGKNQICFFEDQMQEQFSKRYLIEQELRESCANNDFFLDYQAIYETGSNTFSSVEALLRWNYHGSVRTPDTFISIAEDTNIIIKIGYWVIDEAINQLAKWQRRGIINKQISINLSPKQLTDEALPAYIERALAEQNVHPECIQFELTETAFLGHSIEIANHIDQLSQMGCKIALDDFGTGFSSISHLRNFPINTVKIDKSCLPAADSTEKATALLKGLCYMVKALDLKIVVEGIEEDSQVALCKNIGVDKLQGYYFCLPDTPDKIEHLLAKEN